MSTLQANSIVNGEGGALPQFITRPFQNWYINRNVWDNKFNQLYSDAPQMNNESGLYFPTTLEYAQFQNKTYNVWYRVTGGDSVIVLDIDYAGDYNYMQTQVTWDPTYTYYTQWVNHSYFPYAGVSTCMFLVPRDSYWRINLSLGGNPNVKEYKIGLPEVNNSNWVV